MSILTLPNLARTAVLVAIVKFAAEGGIGYGTHLLTLGHADGATYALFLGPILGHSYFSSKADKQDELS